MRLKVLLTTNIPAPYFVDYANELGKYVDLTVVFELKDAVDRDKSWNRDLSGMSFCSVFLDAKRIGEEKGLSFKIKRYLKDRSFNRVIIANPTTPTGIFSLLYCRCHKIPFSIQSEGGFQGSGRGIKEKFKKYLMEKASYYLTGMGGDDDYFLMYGANKDKLRPYCFSSLFANDIDDNVLTQEEKKRIKQTLGIKEDRMILYVGQFIYRKGIDILLKAYKGLGGNACLCLVGGTLNENYKRIIDDNNLNNIYVMPFSTKEELIKLYKAADVFAMTTREDTWGLVINEAMGHGLPVITTKRCIAGMHLINNNINGFIVDVDDIDSIHNKLDILLSNEKLRIDIGRRNIRKIKNYTIEKMAETIYRYLTDNN